MTNYYFELARIEEKGGNNSAALLFYLSSFCDSFNSGCAYPCGAVEKIRRLQLLFDLTDSELFNMVRSYGPLTDQECQQLLYFCIHGYLSGIKTVLTGSAYGC